MSYTEALQWFDYMRRHGGLNRTDRLLATLICQVNGYLGGKLKIEDLLPELRPKPVELGGDVKATVNSVFNMLVK